MHNGVCIDLWAVWKWYMIDKIYNRLEKYSEKFIVNFGWDLRVKWKHIIGLEDPLNSKKVIWKIHIDSLSFACSSGNKRKFWANHHLINPKNKQSENNKIAVYTTHRLASFSDIFATALFISPLEKSIEILRKTKGLEWFIISKSGDIYKSKWFTSLLHM